MIWPVAILLVLAVFLSALLLWRSPELRGPENLRMEHVVGHWADGGTGLP